MSFWKNLAMAGAFLGWLGMSACTVQIPTQPTQRTVTANQTMFANTGTEYTLTASGTKKEPVVMTYKRPCDSVHTLGSTVAMQNDCNGNLEAKVIENGTETLTTTLPIYKGETTTDLELQDYLDTQVGTGANKLDTWNPNGTAFGYEWDALCHRQALGSGTSQNFLVLRIGNNVEESQVNQMVAASLYDAVIIYPYEDQATKIQNYLNQF